MNASDAVAGARGLDTNQVISPPIAVKIAQAGYMFVVRYIRRDPVNANDLRAAELAALLAADLAVMVVQHVESETSWAPSGAKGDQYGDTAATEALKLGLPPGTTVWCDLEGVADGTSAQDTIDYCRSWFAAVQGAGYEPGLYVGFHCGLTPQRLYEMPFARYWASYNLDTDQYPATRGVCLRQHAAMRDDGEFGLPFDVDTAQVDALGGLPTWCTA